MELGNGWFLLDDGWYSKKYGLRRIYARTVHHRFWQASYESLNLQSTKHKIKHSFDLDCFETKRNVINIQYYIKKILTAREGNMVNCHPSKNNVNSSASVDISFWVTI